MKIDRVQYDGEGRWLDVVFDDGKKFRLTSELVRNLCDIAAEGWASIEGGARGGTRGAKEGEST